MKKLIVAVVIVCATAFAKAASCSWDTYAMNEGYEGLDNGTFWLVSLGNNSGAASAFEVYRDGTYNFGGYSVADSGIIPAGTFGAVSGKITGLGESNNNTYYAIVVWDGKADGFYGVAEGKVYGIVSEPPADATPISFDNSGFGGTTLATTPVGVGPEPVPEPTTGILLALGIAGLALRRKRS